MADNVPITAGVGTNIATDDIGGVQHQRVKITLGAESVSEGDVSEANPMPILGTGEMLEALEALRIATQSLARTIGMSYPDVAGRLRVAVDAISAGLTLANVTTVATVSAVTTVSTVSTVTAVTTVATVSNQTSLGGIAAPDQVPALMHLSADSLRRNISVTP